MAGEPLPEPDPIDPRYLSLAAEVGVHVELSPGDSPHIYNVTIIAPDRRGLLSKAAGVLALNSLRVHSASVNGHEGSAINTFVVPEHVWADRPADALLEDPNVDPVGTGPYVLEEFAPDGVTLESQHPVDVHMAVAGHLGRQQRPMEAR